MKSLLASKILFLITVAVAICSVPSRSGFGSEEKPTEQREKFVTLLAGDGRLVANVDLGQVSADKKGSVKLIVNNGLSSDLQFSSVEPSCSCTNASIGNQLIKPGDSTTVFVLSLVLLPKLLRFR